MAENEVWLISSLMDSRTDWKENWILCVQDSREFLSKCGVNNDSESTGN